MDSLARVLVLGVAACGRIHFGALVDGGGEVLPLDVTYTNNIVFVTPRSVIPGSIGSLAAADAICQGYANDARLPGRYIAWLSTTTTNAIDRLAGARGWVRPDGVPFVDTTADLMAGNILTPLQLDQFGQRVGSENVPTATSPSGNVVGGTCNDYTSLIGSIAAGSTDRTHTSYTDNFTVSVDCGTAYQLYCFGVDLDNPITLPPITQLRAFLSSLWSPGGGVTDADAHCLSDAIGAGLGGTWLALLSTPTVSNRFAAGSQWQRLDGIPLQAPGGDAFTGLLTTVNLAIESGLYLGESHYVWRGGAVNHCNEFTSAATAQSGDIAHVNHLSLFASVQTLTCNTPARLWCLEQ